MMLLLSPQSHRTVPTFNLPFNNLERATQGSRKTIDLCRRPRKGFMLRVSSTRIPSRFFQKCQWRIRLVYIRGLLPSTGTINRLEEPAAFLASLDPKARWLITLTCTKGRCHHVALTAWKPTTVLTSCHLSGLGASLVIGRPAAGRAQAVKGRVCSWNRMEECRSELADIRTFHSQNRAILLLTKSNLTLPAGAYNAKDPIATSSEVNARLLGLPHSTMASIVLSHAAARNVLTPLHLRDQLPPPVDFASHMKPPTRVAANQILVQIYAVGIDTLDVRYLDEKGRNEVGKWVPGRSFVGRALMIGNEEKEMVRGDLVMGLVDLRKVSRCQHLIG